MLSVVPSLITAKQTTSKLEPPDDREAIVSNAFVGSKYSDFTKEWNGCQ